MRGTQRTYDYFVLHPSLGPYIASVRTMEEWPSTPHKPILLRLKVEPKQYFKTVQRKPRDLPIGPLACLYVDEPWPEAAELAKGNVTEQWQAVVANVEKETLKSQGLHGDEYCGRDKIPKWVRKPLVWTPKDNGPRGGPPLVAMRWIADKLQTLCHILRRAQRNESAAEGQHMVLSLIHI